mmetsp:Transcript_16082/g.39127  ORF Transcript_16082/g.39127 Transcript_16082/m.39127 type:complete len:320 (+) Transcript_16082:3-962(+)
MGMPGMQGMMGMPGMPGGMAGLPGMPPGMHGMPGMPAQPNPALAQAIMQAQAAARAQANGGVVDKGASAGPPTRIYVGSVQFAIGEGELKQVFAAFGPVKSISMIPNPETGQHKGYGFIDFERPESASQAIQTMNGFDLGGRELKVGWANSAISNPQPFGTPLDPSQMAVVRAAVQAAHREVVGFSGTMISSVASEENCSVSTAAQRAMLMQKLAASSQPQVKPSNVLCLKNMVDPDEVDEQLESEITDECSKHGSVEKVIIATLDEGGRKVVKIFVLFPSPAATSNAIKALDKRFFGGKVVQAGFYDESLFQKQDYTK